LATENLGTDRPLGLDVTHANFPFSPDLLFRVNAQTLKLGPDRKQGELVFTWASPEGLKLIQQMVFYAESYRIDISLQIVNLSSQVVEGRPSLVWAGKVPPASSGAGGVPPRSTEVQARPLLLYGTGEKEFKSSYDLKGEKRPPKMSSGRIPGQYFLAASSPRNRKAPSLY
jgi:YidC/Oxa1 family membrane protein insertase